MPASASSTSRFIMESVPCKQLGCSQIFLVDTSSKTGIAELLEICVQEKK